MKRSVSQEAFQESLQTLADWLTFLDEKERELEAQLARAKAKAGGDSEGGVLSWQDEELPPSSGPGRPQTGSARPGNDPNLPDWLAD